MKLHGDHPYFDICFDDRSTDYLTEAIPARGNYWSTNPEPLDVIPPYYIDRFCDVPLYIPVGLNYEEYQQTAEPDGCHTPGGGNPAPPDPTEACELVMNFPPDLQVEIPGFGIVVPDLNEIIGQPVPGVPVHVDLPDVYTKALHKLEEEDYEGYLARLAVLSKVTEQQFSLLEGRCKSMVRFAQTYIPRKTPQVPSPGYVGGAAGAENIFMEKQKRDVLSGTLYPNPTSGIARLIMPDGDYTATVVDAFGKTIRSRRFTNTTQIDVATAPAGLYFVRVSSTRDALDYTVRLMKE